MHTPGDPRARPKHPFQWILQARIRYAPDKNTGRSDLTGNSPGLFNSPQWSVIMTLSKPGSFYISLSALIIFVGIILSGPGGVIIARAMGAQSRWEEVDA